MDSLKHTILDHFDGYYTLKTMTTEQISVSFKLFRPTTLKQSQLENTMRIGKRVFDQHLHQCRKEDGVTKNSLHEELYSDVRDQYPQLPAALVQSLRDQAYEQHKSLDETGGTCRFSDDHHKPMRLDSRTFSIEEGNSTSFRYVAKISTLDGKRTVPLQLGFYQHQFLENDDYEMKSGYLEPRKQSDGDVEWFLTVTFEVECDVPSEDEIEHYIGVDLNLDPVAAVVVTDDRGNVVEAEEIENRWIEKLEEKQEELSRLRRLSKDTTQKWAEINGLVDELVGAVSKQIVTLAAQYSNACIVMEKLDGLKDKLYDNHSRKLKRQFGHWPYREILNAIQYKAHIAGCAWRQQRPAYSSETCVRCSSYDKTVRNRDGLHCKRCEVRMNSHRSAAYILCQLKRLTIQSRGDPVNIDDLTGCSEPAHERRGLEALMCKNTQDAEPKGASASADEVPVSEAHHFSGG